MARQATKTAAGASARNPAKALGKKSGKEPESEVDVLLGNTVQAPAADNTDAEEGPAGDEGDPLVSEAEAQLDRRIIEGMLKDKDELMVELAKEGVSADEVMRRAADLGISEALLRQVRGVEAELQGGDRTTSKGAPQRLGPRICLSCDRVFLSTGPANRLCMRCRGGDAGLAQC